MEKVMFKGEYMSMETAQEFALLKQENNRLKEENNHLNELCDEYYKSFEKLLKRVNKAIEYIGNGNLGIPRKTREKFIKILKGGKND